MIVKLLCFLIGICGCTKVPLPERKVFFSGEARKDVSMNFAGTDLIFLAPDNNNILNVWLQSLTGKTRMLSAETKRNVHAVEWMYDNQHVLYSIDEKGEENWCICAVNVDTGKTKVLAGGRDVQAFIVAKSPLCPNRVVLRDNSRRKDLFDYYAIDYANGEKRPLITNNKYIDISFDEHLQPLYGFYLFDNGDLGVDRYKKGVWSFERRVVHEDVGILEFVKAWGDNTYWIDSKSSDKGVLKCLSLSSSKKNIDLFIPKKGAIDGVVFDPKSGKPIAVREHYLKQRYYGLTSTMQHHLGILYAVLESFNIISIDANNTLWLLKSVNAAVPHYYIYNTRDKTLQYLFAERDTRMESVLSPMYPVEIKARDGFILPSYISLPYYMVSSSMVPSHRLPLVLYVHGGPWTRDVWRFDPTVQLLCSRGYAVLQVNYRGSTGFGKKFLLAGNLEWGGRMHRDLIDAVNWAISNGIADPKRIGIIGGSYGGYASLLAVAKEPYMFSCGVSMVGIANILTYMKAIPSYWKPLLADVRRRMGDERTQEGKRLLEEYSPLFHVGNIRVPLFVAHGANDQRVKKEESESVIAALKSKKLPYIYMLCHDEGHGFVRFENRLLCIALIEMFLAKSLGGDYEPIRAEEKGRSSALIDMPFFTK